MLLALILKILHVFLAFWLVSGLIGRWVAMLEASKTNEIQATLAMLKIANFFERRMVLPGSMAVFLLGILTAIAQGWPILGFLQGQQPQWLLVSVFLFLTLIPVIRWIFVPRGKIFDLALQDAVAQGKPTSKLADAFHDRVVYAAHIYELVCMAAIIYLMVIKPF